MLIQCTKKLAKASKWDLVEYEKDEEPSFYDWHANLFLYNRRKGVMLMNDATRYCIILYGLKAADFKRFDQIALEAMKETFLAEGFSMNQINAYIENCGEVTYTKTSNRSILSQMSLFDWYVSEDIEEFVPSDSLNLVELNKEIGRIILGAAHKGFYPIELLKEQMEKL